MTKQCKHTKPGCLACIEAGCYVGVAIVLASIVVWVVG